MTGAVSYFPPLTMQTNEMETGSLLSSPKWTEVETCEVSEPAPASESPEPAISEEPTGQAILLLGSCTGAGGALFLESVPDTNVASISPAVYSYKTFLPDSNSREMYPAYNTQGLQSMAPETYPGQVGNSVPVYNVAVPGPHSLNYQSRNELPGLATLAMHNSRYQSCDSLPVPALTEPKAGDALEVIQHSNGVGHEVEQSSIYQSQNSNHHLGKGYPTATTQRSRWIAPNQRSSWITPNHPAPRYASNLRLNVDFEPISALVSNSAPPLITKTRPDTLCSLSLRRDADNGGDSNSYFSAQHAQTDPKELGFNPRYGASTSRVSRYGASTSCGTPVQTVNEGYNNTWRNNELGFLARSDAQARHQSCSDQPKQTDNEIVQYGSSRRSLPSQIYQYTFFQTNDLSPAPVLVGISQSGSLTASRSSLPTHAYQHSFFETDNPPPSGLVSISQSLSITMVSEQPSLMPFNTGDSDHQSLMLYSSSQGYSNRGLGRLDAQFDFFAPITSTSTRLIDSSIESSEGQYFGNPHRNLPRGQVQLDDVPVPVAQDYPQYQNVHTGNTYTGNDRFQTSSSSGFQHSALGEVLRTSLNEMVTLGAEPRRRRQRTAATHDRQGTTQIEGSQAPSVTGGSSLEDNQALAVNVGTGVEAARLEYMLHRGKRTLRGTLNSHLTDSISGERSGMFAAPVEVATNNLESMKLTLSIFIREVDGSWRTYSGHLIEIINLFNSLTCPRAATPYTALALQVMSQYFKCLRDALSAKYRAVRRQLEEQDTAPAPVYRWPVLLTNQLLDQRLRQQRAVQQPKVLQQKERRPQRGLPERAVIILRSWLFNHFLHPYPKDHDKSHLAKQTGLEENQVTTWFINARVRLWKPMVEKMYADEFNSDQTGS